ncbi:hypothetical protein GB931_18930 [Modestobacter sp. I12A-02628]|uniref:ATP/GTP-binding protein n=1 Tax=Goekera deserti TaxID=2497753 RepID=A0A7K3W7H1_9ACTN|nr:hypothetical protein [Goekera deserti]MPQ99953.1 hypothetical protein [Goekera deserti]NDI50112.1 hypothetical protein [Goekera deserti]NEL52411.1 hypothetical protein [Goekera deserti]
MGRRARGRGRPGAPGPWRPRPEQVEEAGDGDWVVRSVTGSATGKNYRCPGCDQEVVAGTPHVVSWPAYARDSDLDPWDTDSAADLRRHWHTTCWRARSRRRQR